MQSFDIVVVGYRPLALPANVAGASRVLVRDESLLSQALV